MAGPEKARHCRQKLCCGRGTSTLPCTFSRDIEPGDDRPSAGLSKGRPAAASSLFDVALTVQ
jgi:hypothetical protein